MEVLTSSIDTFVNMTQALHKACEEGSLLLVSLLLERGLNVNSKDKQGRTPLHIASQTGDRLLAELLHQQGADLCAVTSQGEIPLNCTKDEEMTLLFVRMMAREGKAHLAKERLQLEEMSDKVKEKIIKGLDLKTTRKKANPLSQILSRRTLVNLLKTKETAYQQLSSLSNVSDCSRFSETESGFGETDKSSCDCSTESVLSNLSNSSGFASVDDPAPHFNRRATTPLSKRELTARNHPTSRPRSRFSSEPQKGIVQSSSTWNIVGISRKQSFPPLKKRVPKRVTFPADVLLDIAIKNDDFVETCHLIKSGRVDLNRVGCNGLTPIHRSAIDGSYKCLQLLLDLGADVNVQDELGWRPLHDAVFHGHVQCAIALINAGADLCAQTDDFYTVLDLAENDRMLLVIGRALMAKNNDYDAGEMTSYLGNELFEKLFDPDRETCV